MDERSPQDRGPLPPGRGGEVEDFEELDRMASEWTSRLQADGPSVDPDRVWSHIASRMDEVQIETGLRQRISTTVHRPLRMLTRAARFATVTGDSWGGPLVVGLFALVVVAILIAARCAQVPG